MTQKLNEWLDGLQTHLDISYREAGEDGVKDKSLDKGYQLISMCRILLDAVDYYDSPAFYDADETPAKKAISECEKLIGGRVHLKFPNGQMIMFSGKPSKDDLKGNK